MPTKSDIRKAAAALGRKGGKIGGKAEVPKGFSMMDPERRRALARIAAAKRWGKKRAASKGMKGPNELRVRDQKARP